MKEDLTHSCDVRPLDAPMGAEITGLDLTKPLDTKTADAIVDALYQHLGLVIRGQSLSDAQLIEFTRIFGELELAPPNKSGEPWIKGFPELSCISNIKRDGNPIGSLGNGEAIWHTDMSFMEQPPAVSILYSLRVPEKGGSTHLLNMYKAYETLTEELRRQVEGRVALHDATYSSAGEVRKKFAAYAGNTDSARAPGARHPLVRVHPATGRKALYLGRRSGASCIVGETDTALWDALWEHCCNDSLEYAHSWQVGDLLIWDNRVTMHYREPFDDSESRLMHRTQTKGDYVIAA